jgi:predicted RNA binding protein YcfA (HicA-like mRNA interferase family)
MKIPRDESGQSLINKLAKFEYLVTRQKGSHIRLTKKSIDKEHNITIPNHNPIKVGLLSKILNDVAQHLDITKEELIKSLYE